MTSDNHDDIWEQYAKGVQRLSEKSAEPKQPPAKKKPVKEEPLPWRMEEPVAAKAEEEVRKEVEKPSIIPPAQGEAKIWKKEPLDLRVERNMSLGDVVIEAKLDLHGQTEQAAYDLFKGFIDKQQARGKRMLLVITGKGQENNGPIKTNLPRWCDVAPLEDKVMAVRTAAQHHGGEGAYYILLRKKSG